MLTDNDDSVRDCPVPVKRCPTLLIPIAATILPIAAMILLASAYFAYQQALHRQRSHKAAVFMQLSVNLQKIAVAVERYERVTGSAISDSSSSRARRFGNSWRALILPYVHDDDPSRNSQKPDEYTTTSEMETAYSKLFSLGLSGPNDRPGYTSIYLVQHAVGDSRSPYVVALPHREEWWLAVSSALPLDEIGVVTPRLVAAGNGDVTYIAE